MSKAWDTLHDFWLSQTKDCHCETIMAISVIVALNRWSYVIQWERFKDDCFPGLATKDNLRSFFDNVRNSAWSTHSVFAATTYVYWPANKNATWNQRDMALNLKTAYLKLFSFLLSPLNFFFSTYKNYNCQSVIQRCLFVNYYCMLVTFYSSIETCIVKITLANFILQVNSVVTPLLSQI